MSRPSCGQPCTYTSLCHLLFVVCLPIAPASIKWPSKVALYTVSHVLWCVRKYLQAIPMYIQTIGTRDIYSMSTPLNYIHSKRTHAHITSHIPTSLLVGSLPLAHNAEHFTSYYSLLVQYAAFFRVVIAASVYYAVFFSCLALIMIALCPVPDPDPGSNIARVLRGVSVLYEHLLVGVIGPVCMCVCQKI